MPVAKWLSDSITKTYSESVASVRVASIRLQTEEGVFAWNYFIASTITLHCIG